MITGELKNKINSLWEIFWTGGITNPLDVVEQMTYLMFIHDLDETDNLRARESAMLGLPYESIFGAEVQIGERTVPGSQLKWSVFHDFPAGKMYSVMQEWVFPFIKNLHGDKGSAYAKYMGDAIFKIPTPLMLDKVVIALDEIYAQMAQLQDSDVRGDVYEFLLSKIATAGVNGQFRTPRHIIKMMVELMDPSADEIICDPACGTSGFLVAAGEYLKANRKEEIFYSRELVENHRLEAVISMPSGVFKPYAGVSTGVLIFTKTGHGGTDQVWFYDMRADGFSLDDKRAPVAENDIPDIVARFHNLSAEADRERTEQSFLVPKGEIVENGYDLSINKYKKIEYVPVEYPPTSEIFAQLRQLETEIQKGLEELEGMV